MSNVQHGRSYSKVHNAWKAMRRRCLTKTHCSYQHYGGRGISICKDWDKFENFLADMGEPKKDESLDRINNNLGYSKKNCRWANQKTQQRNRRGNLEVTIFGKTKPLSEWAELGVVSYPTVWFRINSGWEPIHAIFIPNLKAKKLSITNRMKSMATERAKTKILEGG